MQDLSAVLSTALDHHRAGRLDDAEAAYRHVLAEIPDQPNALYLCGTLLLARGEIEAGEPILARAASLRPSDAEIRLSLANARYRRGDLAGAQSLWREALVIAPGHEAACRNLAGQQCTDLDWQGAVETCRDALMHRPESAGIWLTLAAALLMGRIGPAALTAADAALELDDGLSEAWLIRGTVLARAGNFEPALAALHRCLELAPGSARAALHLGNALIDLDRMREAETWLRRAIARDPKLAEAHTSLGFLHSSCVELERAAGCHRAALALSRDLPEAHSNLSATLLLGGDFAGGFAEYEWRKRDPIFSAGYWASDRPEWIGQDLAGRRILLFCEQGFGDTIMCARYLPVLAGLGAAVVVVCAAPLIPLLRGMAGVVELVPRGDPRSHQRLAEGACVPEYDFWIDQMSLPRVLGTDLQTIPAANGYLRADPILAAAWMRRLPHGPKVGLVWAGNPEHHNDRRRSMPAHFLSPLLEVKGVSFISLQCGTAYPGVQDIAAGLNDYAQTAAVIACLDLVISVDTSVAHLAGAMGKPVWLMLPYAPEWRWMLGRSDTPWYDSMRLFRQPNAGEWGAVVVGVATELAAAWSRQPVSHVDAAWPLLSPMSSPLVSCR